MEKLKKVLSIVAEYVVWQLAGLAGGLLVSVGMVYLSCRQVSTSNVLTFLGGIALLAIFLWFSVHPNGPME